MPEETPSTPRENRLDALSRRKREFKNTLGMEPDEYEQYKSDLIEEYDTNKDLTVRGITRREQDKGITLYPDRLRRWLISSGTDIRGKSEAIRKHKSGGRNYSFYLTGDQLETIKQYENMSEIVRLGLNLVLGLPTKNLVLFIGEGKNVLFYLENQIQAYIPDGLTEFEERTIQTLINKAKLHGPRYIINFAIENDLLYYGGDLIDTE